MPSLEKNNSTGSSPSIQDARTSDLKSATLPEAKGLGDVSRDDLRRDLKQGGADIDLSKKFKLPNLDPRQGPDTTNYSSPNPANLEIGRSMRIITNDAQAIAVDQWLEGGGKGAIVISDIRGTKYGFHHAGSPAPRGTHYNISCFNPSSDGMKMGVDVAGDNRTNLRVVEVKKMRPTINDL